MTADGTDLATLAPRRESIADRQEKLEVRMRRGLVESQTVEAKEFVVRDDQPVSPALRSTKLIRLARNFFFFKALH